MHALESAWETVRREFESGCLQSAQAARHQIAHELSQLLRRFRQYRTEEEWVSAVLDGSSKFSSQAAVFAYADGTFRLRASSNLDLPEDFAFTREAAGAFVAVIESKDPVIALRTPSEVTEPLSSAGADDRAHLFPITNGSRTVVVLFAAGQDPMDVDALELVAGMASVVLERQQNAALHSQIAVLPAPNGPGPKTLAPREASGLPSWSGLSQEQRNLHIRAQRFSRVAVAEMQLARPEACRAGREQGNLYLFLKNEIDRARERYRAQFMTIPSMVDYLHLELVQTAAEGDEMKLGADYPGQLL